MFLKGRDSIVSRQVPLLPPFCFQVFCIHKQTNGPVTRPGFRSRFSWATFLAQKFHLEAFVSGRTCPLQVSWPWTGSFASGKCCLRCHNNSSETLFAFVGNTFEKTHEIFQIGRSREKWRQDVKPASNIIELEWHFYNCSLFCALIFEEKPFLTAGLQNTIV